MFNDVRRILTVLGMVVLGLGGVSRPATAQIMVRGFAGGTQATCFNSAATDRREVLTGGDIGFHTRALELNFGGVFSSCEDVETLGNFGLILLPVRTKHFFAGGGLHYDFNDPNQRGFVRPEGVIGIMLKESTRNTRDREGNLIRQDYDGWAIDFRVGRYQERTLYLTAGVAYYFNVWF